MNWGKGLIISMSLFIVFIIGLGIYMVNNNDSLYTDDYYQQGEAHTETMQAIQNGLEVKVIYANDILSIDLGKSGLVDLVKLKHMSENTYDRTIRNSKLDAREVFNLKIPQLERGIWYIEVTGVIDAKAFLKKEKIIIE